MGTWGAGILQNDAAQDSLVEAAYEIEQAIGELAEDPGEDPWPRLLAGIGLLVQFSPQQEVATGQRGSTTRPMNRIAPVRTSRSTNRNG